MKTAQIKALIFLLGVNFILTACLNGAETSIKKDETATNSELISPPPKTDLSMPEGWILFPTPKAENRERACANKAEEERKVELSDGKVKISRYFYQPKEQLVKLPPNLHEVVAKDKNAKGYLHVAPVENGWLIGSDAGEWGGNLFWLSSDASRKAEIYDGNVRGIVKIGKEVFILTGLAHLTFDEGKIHQLTTGENGNLKLKSVADLQTQPQSFFVEDDDSFLVALNNKIIRVKTSGEIETLKETNFNSLYPNSMVVTSAGVVYVGMRLFTVRFVPTENGYEEEWLVPANCRNFIEKNFNCVCQNDND